MLCLGKMCFISIGNLEKWAPFSVCGYYDIQLVGATHRLRTQMLSEGKFGETPTTQEEKKKTNKIKLWKFS